MKIHFKVFLFAVILRMIPAVITSMDIFKNTVFDNLGFNYSSSDNIAYIFSNIIFPLPIDIAGIPGVTAVYFSVASIIGVAILIGFIQAFKADLMPTFVAAISGFIMLPFIVTTGYLIMNETNAFSSPSVVLMIITLLVGFTVFALLTILEQINRTEDVSDS